MSLLLFFNQGSALTLTGDYAASIKAEFRTSGDITGTTGYQITSSGDLFSIHGYAYQNLGDLEARWVAAFRTAFDTFAVQGLHYAASADIIGTVFVSINGVAYNGQFDITSQAAALHQRLYDLSSALIAHNRLTVDYGATQSKPLRRLADYNAALGGKALQEIADYQGTHGKARVWVGDITATVNMPVVGNFQEDFDAGESLQGIEYNAQSDIKTLLVLPYRSFVDFIASCGRPYTHTSDITANKSNYKTTFDYSA